MAEGREWMYNRISRTSGNINLEFVEGVNHFLDYAFTIAQRNGESMVKCPCTKCKLRKYFDRGIIKTHLCKNGFREQYYIWDCHGEERPINPIIYRGYTPINVDSFESTTTIDNYDEQNHVLGCTQMVREVMHPLYIGSANDENDFNTFGLDDDEETRFETNEIQNPNKNAEEFYKLLEDASAPLYDGCTSHTRLSVVAELLSVKSQYNMSDACYDKVASIVERIVPGDNHLPKSFYQSKKMIHGLGLPYFKIDACENNCMLFDGNDKDLMYCKVCGVCRYQEGSIDRGGKMKPISKKVLRYLPITERLKRMYMSSKTSEFMTWHMRGGSGDGSTISHPCQSEAWKHVDQTFPDFAIESRNVRLGLCTDGFNPNSDFSNPYSIWPVFIAVYNLPPELCMKEPYIFMAMLIPGPRSPGRNIDVFLRPLIDELNMLWNVGVETWDAFRKQNFVMRACLIWTISDFPAYGMLSGWSTHGRLACPYCLGEGVAQQLKFGKKPCWWGCHRRFLRAQHGFRRDSQSWGVFGAERRRPCPIVSGAEILRNIESISFPPFGSQYDNLRADGFGKTHNWIKKSIFWDLPYWKDLLVRHNPDVMHIEKNCFDNVFNTVMDVKGRTKDNSNSRRDMELLSIRKELHLYQRNMIMYQPKASYVLDKAGVINICNWLREEVKLPDGYSSNIGHCVNTTNNTFYSMKSHDCHVFMQRLLPIALRGYLQPPLWTAISEFCKFFRIICAKKLCIADIEKLQDAIAVTLCKLEKVFPPSFFDSMEHLTVHLPWELKICGPVHYRWMYPFERLMKKLKEKAKNKQFLEGSIVEKFWVQEVALFCEHYFDNNSGTRINPHVRNEVGANMLVIGEASNDFEMLSVFKHPVRNFSRLTNHVLSDEELHHVHSYVLFNTPEVQPYITHFENLTRQSSPRLNDSDVAKHRMTHFATWFELMAKESPHNFTSQLIELSQWPKKKAKSYGGSYVNGYKFHTRTYGGTKRTSNWGVCVLGQTSEADHYDFYGMVDEIWELFYKKNKVTIFKGTWFDPTSGVRIHEPSGVVDVRHTSRLHPEDPFILASQAQQVYYVSYPTEGLRDWLAVIKNKPRHLIEVDTGTSNDQTSLFDVEADQDDFVVEDAQIQDDPEFDGTDLLVNFGTAPQIVIEGDDDEILDDVEEDIPNYI
ncbi:unnamed protein product [Cuscuta epithymum]|uniref:Uncharacterized protein n=2 Tax=Cuscuta epithymum TaxID=186058 RepID=A0AAV0F6C7_9ASTE|nr:unnamed protein product [Cuscuta epithymum]